MDDILDMLMQEIERDSSSRFCAGAEYRQQRFQALLHMNWLEERLDEEELAHLEKALEAELRIDTLEREAMARTALAVGVRLALPN